jgi:hypothetical protein
MHIEYLEQILPFEPLDVYVWHDPVEKALLVRFVIHNTGRVASTVVFGALQSGLARL